MYLFLIRIVFFVIQRLRLESVYNLLVRYLMILRGHLLLIEGGLMFTLFHELLTIRLLHEDITSSGLLFLGDHLFNDLLGCIRLVILLFVLIRGVTAGFALIFRRSLLADAF